MPSSLKYGRNSPGKSSLSKRRTMHFIRGSHLLTFAMWSASQPKGRETLRRLRRVEKVLGGLQASPVENLYREEVVRRVVCLFFRAPVDRQHGVSEVVLNLWRHIALPVRRPLLVDASTRAAADYKDMARPIGRLRAEHAARHAFHSISVSRDSLELDHGGRLCCLQRRWAAARCAEKKPFFKVTLWPFSESHGGAAHLR